MPAARRSALKELANAAAADPSLFRPSGTLEDAIARLRKIRGIGEWTAQYIALRAMRETDAFPAADIGLLRGAELLDGARSTASNLLMRSESWRPWRAYAAQHLWAADAATIAESRGFMSNILQLFIDRIDTPIGTLLLVADRDGNLRAIDWSEYESRMLRFMQLHYGKNGFRFESIRNPHGLRDAMQRYFAGDIDAIDDLPVKTAGTAFQRSVWSELRKIAGGTTISYGQLAGQIGRPSAVRAVGLANGSNPIGIVVPCHRVIGSNGSLTGYGGGLQRKQWLLEHERKQSTSSESQGSLFRGAARSASD
jgi:methylated-DNA-[protein]-cysteine S-methyltransferase